MKRYNKDSANGKRVIARFCSCGHSAIIASDSTAEHHKFEEDWKVGHTGYGHEMIDVDQWVANILKTSLASI